MLLRNSISNTKKFFQKTLQSFKSFFSGSDYQRIPKTPPHNPYSYPLGAVDTSIQASYKDLDRFYTDFTNQWESTDMEKANRKRSNKKKNITSSPMKQENKEVLNGSFMKFAKACPVKNNINQKQSSESDHQYYLKPTKVHEDRKIREEDSSSTASTARDQERSCLLAEKLKELELMDMSNVDHLLDIEEFFHYYSRITCPAYLDIVDKFFTEMYTEFFGACATPVRITSRPKLRS